MRIKPIPRRSTVDQVVERILTVIKQDQLLPGMRLPGELELVEQLQVSRPALREALARLDSLGLVSIQRGRGTFVGDRGSLVNCIQLVRSALTISPRELLKYAELRSAIEVQAVRLAAQRATAADVLILEELLREMNDVDRPYDQALEIDFRFHRKIVEISGNELMQNVMEVIYEFVLAQMARTTPVPRNNELGHRLHHEIVAAIRQQDPSAAERAMRTHMEAVLHRLTAHDAQAAAEPAAN